MLLVLLLPSAGFAQATSALPEKSELRRQVENDIMCTCGCRAPMNNCPMGPSCHGLEALNAKLDTYFAQGLTRDQIRRALVADHGGQDILTAPIDTGFNRLAWMFPYVVGIVGAGAIALAAKRWSRHDAASRAGATRWPPTALST